MQHIIVRAASLWFRSPAHTGDCDSWWLSDKGGISSHSEAEKGQKPGSTDLLCAHITICTDITAYKGDIDSNIDTGTQIYAQAYRYDTRRRHVDLDVGLRIKHRNRLCQQSCMDFSADHGDYT